MNTTLTDNEQVTVYGHLKRGSLNYYYIHKDGKWLLLPWISRPTHGTPTAAPDLDANRYQYGRMGWGYPIKNTNVKHISVPFWDPEYFKTLGTRHVGIDLVNRTQGESTSLNELVAAAAGTVVAKGYVAASGKGRFAKGHYIAIKTDDVDPANSNKLIIVYQHMNEAAYDANYPGGRRDWVVGDRVSKGQMVGRIGNSDILKKDSWERNENAYHLHFQVDRTGTFSLNTDLKHANFVNPFHFYPTVNFTASKEADRTAYYQ